MDNRPAPFHEILHSKQFSNVRRLSIVSFCVCPDGLASSYVYARQQNLYVNMVRTLVQSVRAMSPPYSMPIGSSNFRESYKCDIFLILRFPYAHQACNGGSLHAGVCHVHMCCLSPFWLCAWGMLLQTLATATMLAPDAAKLIFEVRLLNTCVVHACLLYTSPSPRD